MTITVKAAKVPQQMTDGKLAVRGRAYRLVRQASGCAIDYIGNVYIATTANLTNVKTGEFRNRDDEDRYVEVDLEIIVKERT